MHSSSSDASKYMLVLLNFTSMLLGAGVVALGLYATSVGAQVRHLISVSMPVSVLLLGIGLLISSLVGLGAAFSGNRMALRASFAGLALMLLVQMVSSGLALGRRQDLDLKLYDAWDRALDRDRPLLEKIEKTVQTN